MSRSDWMPKGHTPRYNLAVRIFKNLIGDIRDRAGLTKTPGGDWYDDVYTPKCTAMCNAYEVWNEFTTRTPIAIDVLNSAEGEYVPLCRKLYTGFLRENPLITDADLDAMGFPKHPSGGHTPSPVAETAPYLIATAAGARIVDIGYGATQASRSKPAGQHGIEVIHEVSDTKPELEQMTRSDFDTRTPLRITFHDSERGKTLWFAGRWENTRGQKGPFGEIQSIVIP